MKIFWLHASSYVDAFDTEQLLECIETLKCGKSVQVPIYDFKNHRRCSDVSRQVIFSMKLHVAELEPISRMNPLQRLSSMLLLIIHFNIPILAIERLSHNGRGHWNLGLRYQMNNDDSIGPLWIRHLIDPILVNFACTNLLPYYISLRFQTPIFLRILVWERGLLGWVWLGLRLLIAFVWVVDERVFSELSFLNTWTWLTGMD